MGVSTNAILYYGFDFYNEEDDEPEITEQLQKFLGLGEFEDQEEYYDVTKNDPFIDIDYHCSANYRIWYVCYKPHHFIAHRGYPYQIDNIGQLGQDMSAMDAQLKTFCDQHGIPWQQPKWNLASYWG